MGFQIELLIAAGMTYKPGSGLVTPAVITVSQSSSGDSPEKEKGGNNVGSVGGAPRVTNSV